MDRDHVQPPIRLVLILVGLVLSGPPLLFALLLSAELVPDAAIVAHLDDYRRAGGFQDDYTSDGLGGAHDRFTECIGLTYGLGFGVHGDDVLRHAARGMHAFSGSCKTTGRNIKALAGGHQLRGEEYFRYWHGYSVVTRPLIATVGVERGRALVAMLLAASALFAFSCVGRGLGWGVSAALLLPALISTNVASSPQGSITHAVSWSVIFLGVGVVVVATRRRGMAGGAFASGLVGVAFNYVDLLTTPAVPWAWSTFVVAAIMLTSTRSVLVCGIAAVMTAMAWALGYGLAWSSKWAITAILLGPDTFEEVTRAAAFRLGGEDPHYTAGLGIASASNLKYWVTLNPSATVVLILVATALVGASLKVARSHGARSIVLFSAAASPSFIIPLWYETVANHSQIHVFFTYRAIPAAIGVIAAAAIVASQTLKTFSTSSLGSHARVRFWMAVSRRRRAER